MGEQERETFVAVVKPGLHELETLLAFPCYRVVFEFTFDDKRDENMELMFFEHAGKLGIQLEHDLHGLDRKLPDGSVSLPQ